MSFKTKQFDGLSGENVSSVNSPLTSLCYFLRDSQKTKGAIVYPELINLLSGKKTITTTQVSDLFEALVDTTDKGITSVLSLIDGVSFDQEDNRSAIRIFLEELKAPVTHYNNPTNIAREIEEAKNALDANGITIADSSAFASSLNQAINDNSQTTEDGADLECFRG